MKHQQPRRIRSSGLMLIDMLFTIALLSVLAVIGTHLFTLTCRLCHDAPATQEAIARHESALETLREDAWSAHAFTVENDRSLTIDGGATRWSIDATGNAERDSSAGTHTWAGAFAGATFAVRGPVVVIQTSGQQTQLPSQVLLATAKRGGK